MSAPNDPLTKEEARELVRDELANALEEADIDLGDLPQREGTTRRELLKAAGIAGSAGLLGAGGMNAATEPASAGSSSAGDWGTADNPGDFWSEDHYAVDQASGGLTTPPSGYLNFGFENGTPKYVDNAGTYRDLTPFTDGDGDGVYTLPNAGDGIDVGSVGADDLATITVVSPGEDLQSRVDAAEPGGVLFFESGEHDVATMGTATINKPITVRMSGGQMNNDSKGAVLVNSGADTVDSPVLTVANSSPGTFSSRPFKVVLDSINIYHEGGTSPALKINDAPIVHLRDPLIDCGGSGDSLIELTNRADLFTVRGGQLRRPASDGIVDNGTGGARSLIQANIVGVSGRSSGTGLTTNNTWITFGGQIAGFTNGIDVESDHCWFHAPRIEDVNDGIRFGAAGTSRRSHNWVTGAHFTTVDGVCVEFGLSSENHVVRPRRLVNGANSTNCALFSADSIRDRVAGSYGQLSGKSWDTSGAPTRPTVQLDPLPVVNDTNRGNLNPLEGMVVYNETDGNLNIRASGGWILPDGTAT